MFFFFFFSSRRRHTRCSRDWSSDVCSSDLSQFLYQPTPPSLTAGQTHGLVSCSEWTGVPLRLLLEEAGVDPGAPLILAEGGGAAAMSRSVPMAKAMDGAELGPLQNRERRAPRS